MVPAIGRKGGGAALNILSTCGLDVGVLLHLNDQSVNGRARYNPIPEESFDFEVYQLFYGSSVPTMADDPLLSHRLSLIFLVFAIGTLMDTNMPAYHIEAEKYFQLSRAALFHDSFVDSPTINAVQALVCLLTRLRLLEILTL